MDFYPFSSIFNGFASIFHGQACMDTVAACGDVCRNVLCTSRPDVCSKELHEET